MWSLFLTFFNKYSFYIKFIRVKQMILPLGKVIWHPPTITSWKRENLGGPRWCCFLTQILKRDLISRKLNSAPLLQHNTCTTCNVITTLALQLFNTTLYVLNFLLLFAVTNNNHSICRWYTTFYNIFHWFKNLITCDKNEKEWNIYILHATIRLLHVPFHVKSPNHLALILAFT